MEIYQRIIMNNKNTSLVLILITVMSVLIRLLPHPANFVPMGALAITSGLYAKKKWQLLLPLGAMFATDFFIGFYDVKVMAVVYASFLISAFIGVLVSRNKNFLTVAVGTLAGSVIFYLVTNFAVWAFSGMYVHNFGGLMTSYVMALPFFGNSLLGDFFYVGILVGSAEFAIFAYHHLTSGRLAEVRDR